MASSNKNIIFNNETLLTRKDVCEESHIELSYLDSLVTYYDLKHIKKDCHFNYNRIELVQSRVQSFFGTDKRILWS